MDSHPPTELDKRPATSGRKKKRAPTSREKVSHCVSHGGSDPHDIPVKSQSYRRNPKKWLHADGTSKTDAELKAETPDWSPTDWEAYLTSTETGRKETLLERAKKRRRDDDSEWDDHDNCGDSEARTMADLFKKDSYPRLRSLLVSHLSRLPGSQKEALNLRFFEELETGEVAERMGLAPSTVRSAIGRGLKTLKKQITEDLKPVSDKKTIDDLLAALEDSLVNSSKSLKTSCQSETG